MVNRVVLIGRLTKDPELRKTKTGISVTSFTLAFTNRAKNADGTFSSSFITCNAWNKTAEIVVEYCKKGSQVCVDGSLLERKYKRKDGTNASVVEVTIENLELLGRRDSSTTTKEDSEPADYQPDETFEKNDAEFDDLADDDLPF